MTEQRLNAFRCSDNLSNDLLLFEKSFLHFIVVISAEKLIGIYGRA